MTSPSAARFGSAADPVARAAAVAALGQRDELAPGDAEALRAAARDPDGRVRAAALGALVRRAASDRLERAWRDAVTDVDPGVRRRAAELAPVVSCREPGVALGSALVGLLDDGDVTVVEAAAWALGELTGGSPAATAALSIVAREHGDPLAREAAVAALGARGDESGVPAIVHACRDIPAVRRRAVLALAPFSGPAVDAAFAAALGDRDWQVRQAAEDLTEPPASPEDRRGDVP
ncbi:MAG TPA: HEAT repeat domain-containing protein [Acidimicrobiia bacterium]|nr:HEAT repeat domain-containing protein [Acidimicrobiia bacterium]